MHSGDVLRILRLYESRNLTFIDPDGSWPIVWDRAQGVHVWDLEGRKYLDLTAGFGVAAAGHANARVVKAGQRQLARLPHALADIHPHPLRAELAQLLSRLTFERWSTRTKARESASSQLSGKVIFCSSGFEAVEAALKTAILATGKSGIIAFQGAYHGLGYGALNVTQRDHFRTPFRAQLREFGHFVRFPTDTNHLETMESEIRRHFRTSQIGAILAEPIQVRGGVNVPPSGFLQRLRALCDEFSVPLILDEIYTGFGRTGRWFACDHSDVWPDIVCVGKALAGGVPLSACIGRSDMMDSAWPAPTGDPIHTSTFLGNPVACAMAIAQIKEIKRLKLISKCARLGRYLLKALSEIPVSGSCCSNARGLGLVVGLELRLPNGLPATALAFSVVKSMLQRGYLLLPDGEDANVIEFTPPLTINRRELARAVEVLADALAA